HRFHFIAGDSREVLPLLWAERPRLLFDAFHIDGGHSASLLAADLSNAIRLASEGAIIMIDDLNAPHLYTVFRKYIELGYFLAPTSLTFLPTKLHSIVQLSTAAVGSAWRRR